MQQMFNCPRCGWQNVIGQRFCGSCGETFQYNCPYCTAFVDPAYNSCPSCGAPLTWGFQQQTAAAPAEQAPAYQQQSLEQQQTYQQPPREAQVQPRKTDDPAYETLKKKRKMNQMLVLIAATGLLICIGIAIYLVITTFSQKNTPAPYTPPVSSSSNETSMKPFENDIVITLEIHRFADHY